MASLKAEAQCSRCDADTSAKPSMAPGTGWNAGHFEKIVHTARMQMVWYKPWEKAVTSSGSVSVLYTDITLCSECWGDFLTFVTEPKQKAARDARNTK